MAGLVGSIFGKTVQELQQERIAERKQAMADAMRVAQQQGGNTGVAALGSLFGSMLGEKIFGGEAMDKAREAEAQQTALNERIKGMRSDDPRYYMALSDAYSSTGNTEDAAKYAQIAARYEDLAERRRQQYRDEEMKLADALSEQLDLRDKGIYLSTIFDKDTPEEERNKALQNFYQVGGTANDLYAYQQIGENLLKGNKQITKRQEDITDKFVSDITNGVASPAEVYGNYKSIYGDDFIVPGFFLDRFNTNNSEQPSGTKPVSGEGLNLTADNSNKNNKTPSVSKQKEANLGTLYDVLGLPTEEEVKRAGTYAFRPWEL